MSQFVTYFFFGLLTVWMNLFVWGFSNGPTSTAPYFAIIGALLLFSLVAPLALFVPRLAAGLALLTVIAIVPWPVQILVSERSFGGFAFLSLPAFISGTVAVRYIYHTRKQRWFAASSSPRLAVRIPLAVLPVALFLVAFNARLVMSLLLEGPPK